jgi:hypothetical protein
METWKWVRGEEKSQFFSQLEMNIKSSQRGDQEKANIVGSFKIEKAQSNQKALGVKQKKTQ